MLSNPSFKDEFYGTRLNIPSKTFLLGEYGALVGEAALLCATGPTFQMVPTRDADLVGVHPESPAGLLWRQSAQSFGLEFTDPHQGAGGFGASGAQFLGAFALLEFHKSGERIGASSWGEILNCYKELLPKDEGLGGSGADLISQLVGEICYFDFNEHRVEAMSWPFKNLEFVLFKTPGKVPTHDHLKTLSQTQVQGLGQITSRGWQALKSESSGDFLQAISEMNDELMKRGFAYEPTQSLLAELKDTGLILAGKGCGALGADVLAVFCKPETREVVLQHGLSLGLRAISGRQDISAGLRWEWKEFSD